MNTFFNFESYEKWTDKNLNDNMYVSSILYM